MIGPRIIKRDLTKEDKWSKDVNPEVCDNNYTEDINCVVTVLRVIQALFTAKGPVGACDEP